MYQRDNRERIDGRGGGVGRALGVGVGRGVTLGVTVGVALGVGVGVGVAPGPPPFAVHRIVPLSPTAIPRNASLAKETSLRLTEVPLVWSVQVIPASVLCEIRPLPPTANPLVGCGKSIPWIA
jgi:hypothetical protein